MKDIVQVFPGFKGELEAEISFFGEGFLTTWALSTD